MSDTKQNNRRSMPRLLCNDQFSDSSLAAEGETFIAHSINFNRLGIALFTSDPLPDIQFLSISFELCVVDELDNEVVNEIISVKSLPCFIRHVSDLDVGSQYGIEFNVEEAEDGLLKGKLARIEEILLRSDQCGDRYGIFS